MAGGERKSEVCAVLEKGMWQGSDLVSGLCEGCCGGHVEDESGTGNMVHSCARSFPITFRPRLLEPALQAVGTRTWGGKASRAPLAELGGDYGGQGRGMVCG